MVSNEDMLIVEAAKIVGDKPYSTRGEWELAVARGVARLRYLMNPNSVPSRIVDSVVLHVRILDVMYEESSTRFVVTFRELRASPDSKLERIRSDRTDGPNGKAVRDMWEGTAGHVARLYKYLDSTGDPDKPSVRVAPLVEILN